MTTRKLVTLNYSPRPWQFHMHKNLKRFNVVLCHRRAGKTVGVVAEVCNDALKCTKRNPQYAYIAPTFGQAKKIAWSYFKDALKDIPGFVPNESELRISIHRTWLEKPDVVTIYLLGAENYDGIRGMYFDGVVLDEYGEMNPQIWSTVVRPALSDRMGWAIIMGTPKGKNDFKDKYDFAGDEANKDWFRFMLRASDSKILPQEELDAMKREMGDEQYEQEMECSFSAGITGAYFAKELGRLKEAGKIGKFAYDPLLMVDCIWDIGVSDSTAIWFRQNQNGVFRYIDYLEMSGEGIPYYLKKVKEKPYVIDRWIFPHDVRARDWSTGVSREEQLRKLGIRVTILPKLAIEERIAAARVLLPKCEFDEERCVRGLLCLENYTKKWDDRNQIWSDRPLHNWASHGADAFCYSALEVRDNQDIYYRQRQESAVTDYDTFGG